jgi:hypothetical protein
METKPKGDRTIIIEREEYDALMSELPEPEISSSSDEIEERFRKIDFYLMIIVGLILLVLLISQGR